MSIIVLAKVFYLHLSGDLKLLLLAMADHADDAGERVFPSVGLLAIKCSVSERSVQRKLGTLKELGLIEVVVAGGGRARLGQRSRTTEYRIVLPKGDKLSPIPPTPTLGPERVTPGTELVTSVIEKGDATKSPESSRSVMEPPRNVAAIGEEFVETRDGRRGRIIDTQRLSLAEEDALLQHALKVRLNPRG